MSDVFFSLILEHCHRKMSHICLKLLMYILIIGYSRDLPKWKLFISYKMDNRDALTILWSLDQILKHCLLEVSTYYKIMRQSHNKLPSLTNNFFPRKLCETDLLIAYFNNKEFCSFQGLNLQSPIPKQLRIPRKIS